MMLLFGSCFLVLFLSSYTRAQVVVCGKCSPLCGTGVYTHAGTCQPNGKCLCFWGWTGPNAYYIKENRIMADYCRIPCHYTPDYRNPVCVSSKRTGGECKVPTSLEPKNPCDPKCGNQPFFGRGVCLSNGRCLCWWGWTGPDACYVESGEYRNRIIANYCARPCHFTPYVRNPKCLNGSWDDSSIYEKKTNQLQTVKVSCNPLCGTGVYTHAGTCQPNGKCLCFWGWTGPNAYYIKENRIMADYCRIPCHYTPDYRNPVCVSSKRTGGECKVPTSLEPKNPCDPKCGNQPYFGRGVCLSNGRCLCWWGWTGPNACYVESGEYRNRIIANYCARPCHFTPYVRNPKCLNGSWDDSSINEKKTNQLQTAKVSCNPLCGTGVYTHAGTCQPNGKCLCFWGWTGPNAYYIKENRIMADYCRIPCHYTPDYRNPVCVSSRHTGGECKVPTSLEPKNPCDPKCGNQPFFGRGVCLSNGRCLCWWGWTGPNACYVESGEYRNRIIANYCARPCHFTPYVRNPKCLNGSWDDSSINEKKTNQLQTVKVSCNPLCGTGVYTHAGTCQPNGKCLCFWGWTGPNAYYIKENRIMADYCRIPCHYTPDYRNPVCVSSKRTGGECKVPTSLEPKNPCDPKCGNQPYFGRGVCLSNGRCLCWWGWTGPNACYVESGEYRNRIIANYCARPCHFTPYVRNPKCLNGSWDDSSINEKKTNQLQTAKG
ncbi:tenascin-like isoform X2 [Xenia sp. Carnegie-2017]|uniref:tenascin-like isoform X2 n=1 Tax=Xenia sp. Carnegie-2017 TaxID=2897299 RepID=UPI001F034673|nr:tenascin-like isoform X2 [Xenia sp. Carnegie-2017]